MRLRIASLLLLLLLPAAASAASPRDGRLAIDRACAPVGCFPGDAPGYPVEITAPGSYLVTSDLDVNVAAAPADTGAIDISAPAVDLDLGGFTLTGPVECSGSPIDCTPASGTGIGIRAVSSATGVRIHDGAVDGFGQYGVKIDAPFAAVRALRLTNHRSTALLVTGLSARVEEVAVAYCGGAGVFFSDAASAISGSSASNLGALGIGGGAATAMRSNVVDVAWGVYSGLQAGDESLLTGNVVFGADHSIYAEDGALVDHNIADAGQSWSLQLGLGTAYTGNVLYQSGDHWADGGNSLGQNYCDMGGC